MKKKKNTKIYILNFLIIFVCCIILIAFYLEISNAKYTKEESKSDESRIAKWSFKDGDTSSDIELIADSTKYPNIESGTIAPGTSGNFDVSLDASGCDTGIEYTISFSNVEGSILPVGLKIDDTNSTGIIPYSSIASEMKKNITIKWEWTYGDISTQDNYDENLANGMNNSEAGITSIINVKIHCEQIVPGK